jgi:lipopolysaccharide transport system ATP-binding protein
MRRAELDRKFDQIVEFSELERFLDTPVKRYSSGMYMRLAFAVASHLESEILVVDEVLAVGDAQFQKRCLGKMSNVAMHGRTVLFVSHNMNAVQSLCRRAIWLDHGKVIKDGAASSVVNEYLASGNTRQLEEDWHDVETAPGNDIVRLHRIRVRPESGYAADALTVKTPFVIEIEYWNLIPRTRLQLALHLYTEQDIIAFTTGNGAQIAANDAYTAAGLFRGSCYVPGDLLNTGRHRFVLVVVKDRDSVIYTHESAISFEILDQNAAEAGFYGREPGVVQPVLKWTTEQIDRVK